MTNYKLIAKAIELALATMSAEDERRHDLNRIDKLALDWYNHTEITDVETLAAVILYGDFNPEFRYDDIMEIKEHFFPSTPIELAATPIEEIEAAMHDAKYW